MSHDRELADRIVARDEAAFDEVLARHGPAVRQRLVQMLRNQAAADDLLQEVSLRLWTRAGQWDGRGSLAAWLMRIATNLALNHLRARGRRRERPLRPTRPTESEEEDSMAPGWLIDASAIGPDAVLEAAEQRASMRSLVDDLPEEKREVLRLAHEHEMTMRDIAETLGVPEGTAKSRLHYAVRRLAEAWHERMAGEEDT